MQHGHFIKTAPSPEPSAEEDHKKHQPDHLARISWITGQADFTSKMKIADEPRE